MVKKILIYFLFFYILALFQTSFLIHFNLFLGRVGWCLNLILISVILLNLFENLQQKSGILAAFIGGFFWDIFSENFIGFYILILLGVSIFIKFILKKYVRTPTIKRTSG